MSEAYAPDRGEETQEERLKKRKAEAIEGYALMLFLFSHASAAQRLTPGQAYGAAEQFINFALQKNPNSDLRGFPH